jgi:uncharacterized membrane protein (DUF106 family)
MDGLFDSCDNDTLGGSISPAEETLKFWMAIIVMAALVALCAAILLNLV